MFDDRIEIFSPGGMVSGTNLEKADLMNIPSRRRNPVLADIFSRLIYMERRGSGFKKILEDYRIQENYCEDLKPKFYADNTDFILTLYNLNTRMENDVTQDVTQESIDEKILSLIRENPKISTEKMADALKVTARTIKRHIKDMDNLEFIGQGFSGHWEIK